MKIEIGSICQIKSGPASDFVEIEVLGQVLGRVVKIAGVGISESMTRTTWTFEEPIPISIMGMSNELRGITTEFLQPIVPPGLSIETDADVPVEEVA